MIIPRYKTLRVLAKYYMEKFNNKTKINKIIINLKKN
jgi:hypothetical protein